MLSRLLNRFKRPTKKPGPAGQDDLDAATVLLPAQEAGSALTVPEWQPGETILDRYLVEQVLSGSMGKIYICEHLGWKVKIAVKSPRPEVLADREGFKRILTEANSWIRMGMHPNVAVCYYVLAISRIPHLFIEYIDGGSLADWIKTGRTRNLRIALSLAIQFCHGMEFTHGQGIIHRDIKPHNILITKNSLLKITDFGILLSAKDGKREAETAPSPENTAEEATVGFRGTPGYASPEQLRSSHDVDERTDIFSFGLCLWLMLCGKKPYANNTVKTELPVPTPLTPKTIFPPPLKQALTKSVAFDAADRYRNFAELRADLNHAYSELFGTPCPYAESPAIDLRADSLNNRAVSLIELGAVKDAVTCLQQTLEINDTLPEAIYNLLLLKWRSGRVKPDRLLRQLEAARQRGSDPTLLNELETAIKQELLGGKLGGRAKGRQPEFRLCAPRNSLEVFREGQLQRSVQRNILDHLEHHRYQACHDVLITAWRHSGFRKDRTFNQVYEQLLRHGRKEHVLGSQRFFTLRGYGSPAIALAYLPKTRKIVTADSEGQLVIRDLSAAQKVSRQRLKEGAVRALAACPKGSHLAVGTATGVVGLISPRSARMLSSEQSHQGPVLALAFNHNGRYLASGGSDGILKVRKLSTGPETSVSVQEGGAIRSITFFEKGKDLVTGSEDGTLRFWEQGGKECTRISEAHALPVVALTASPDGKRLASASPDRQVKIWDRHSGRCLKTIKAHDEAITAALILADNQTLVTGCEDDLIKLWDLASGKHLLTVDGRGDGIYSLAPGPRPHTFLAGRKDGAVVLWIVVYQLAFP